MRSVRDFISHEWQSVGALQARLEEAGFPMPEVKLIELLKNMPCVIIQNNQVRQIPYNESKP